jgi:hypothetical protein
MPADHGLYSANLTSIALANDIDKPPGRSTMVGVGGHLRSRSEEDQRSKGTKNAYSNRATIDLGADGEIKVHVWVLDKDGARPGAETTSAFVDADSAVVVTLNGQRQDSEKRVWIKGCGSVRTSSPA